MCEDVEVVVQVHFPFHPAGEYLEMRHILAVVDPRYLPAALHHK